MSNTTFRELERWGKYCYVPLDVPVFDYPEIIKWFFENCQVSKKISSDVASPGYGNSLFNTIDIQPNGSSASSKIWTVNFQNDFLDLFPDFYPRLLNDLPFKSISYMKFWSSIKEIPWHRDQTKFIDFPGSFRISLYDENPNSTLKLVDSLPDEKSINHSHFTLPRLQGTNSFVWNNLRTKHSSTFDPAFRKILLIIDSYELDVERYHVLLNRSIEKYRDELMISDNGIDAYIK